ncbi:hypothetical protein [Deinococcus multiflagellatus]|uniref:hypothetical protein n=1 Tax=Deinococcus multiflagellatus TaxID=1656887 RepID=UPI001CCAF3AD|nr:hypothetical protein [Deinococcus multiflagellatus]MBZ9713821.1 hypothetical protein [Deinococcus multiflagellatus]
MTLETSEREFTARFAPHAASGVLYPQREGSPLLEFAAGGRVLYLFDRSGPYATRPGPAQVVVHGVLDPEATRVLAAAEDSAETLQVVGVSAVEGRGRVLAAERGVLVVQARLPLVLATLGAPLTAHPGDLLAFRTQPPLHGFLVGPA